MSDCHPNAPDPSVVIPKNVEDLFARLKDIDERPYDFVGRLDVPGAVQIGTLSLTACRLHAAAIMAQQQLAEARRAYESAKAYYCAVEGLFYQSVSDQFPAVVTVEQHPGGATIKIQNGLFFGEGWAVYRADPNLLKQAKHHFRRQRHQHCDTSEDTEGLLGVIIGDIFEN
jgi:hypothetical protein